MLGSIQYTINIILITYISRLQMHPIVVHLSYIIFKLMIMLLSSKRQQPHEVAFLFIVFIYLIIYIFK